MNEKALPTDGKPALPVRFRMRRFWESTVSRAMPIRRWRRGFIRASGPADYHKAQRLRVDPDSLGRECRSPRRLTPIADGLKEPGGRAGPVGSARVHNSRRLRRLEEESIYVPVMAPSD
nr:hypothetical protein CFP56_52305 [Quercus suber]